jgi:hypothetical protein
MLNVAHVLNQAGQVLSDRGRCLFLHLVAIVAPAHTRLFGREAGVHAADQQHGHAGTPFWSANGSEARKMVILPYERCLVENLGKECSEDLRVAPAAFHDAAGDDIFLCRWSNHGEPLYERLLTYVEVQDNHVDQFLRKGVHDGQQAVW